MHTRKMTKDVPRTSGRRAHTAARLPPSRCRRQWPRRLGRPIGGVGIAVPGGRRRPQPAQPVQLVVGHRLGDDGHLHEPVLLLLQTIYQCTAQYLSCALVYGLMGLRAPRQEI